MTIAQNKGPSLFIEYDAHPSETSLELLAKLPAPFRDGGIVTADNASGVNDGAAALIIASGETAARYGFTPVARILGARACACIALRVKDFGP